MGGNAFPEVGAIHLSEVAPTLHDIATKLNLSEPLVVLGSVGKKDFSGDIDIALDIPAAKQREFVLSLKTVYGDHSVRKLGGCISVPSEIIDYDSHLETSKARTGKVQVDFIFGDTEWLSFYYHSPLVTKFKGTHRNIAISTLAGFTDRIEINSEKDDDKRTVDYTRYKWSSKTGLSYVRRTSKRNKTTGKWQKKQTETQLKASMYHCDEVAAKLFNTSVNKRLDAKDLDSFESVLSAIQLMYKNDLVMLDRVMRQIAVNLSYHPIIGKQAWDYPECISKHINEA